MRIPTLILEGTADTLFTLHEAIENYTALRAGGVPVKMVWFCGGHGVCTTNPGDTTVVERSVVAWLKRYLHDDASVDTGPGFRWISDDGVLRSSESYPPPAGPPLRAQGAGTLTLTPASTSGALIAALPAASAVSVDVPAPAAATQLVGEPTMTLSYSGTAADRDARVFAQSVDITRGIVLGNQATPIPLTLDGTPRTVTRSLEGVVASLTPTSRLRLQITDGSNLYGPQRTAGAVTFSKVDLSLPTGVAAAASPAPAPAASLPACTGPSKITFRLGALPRQRVVRVRALVDGKSVISRSARSLRSVTLSGLPRDGYMIRIETTSNTGVRRISERLVRDCRKGAPRTRTVRGKRSSRS